MPWLWVQDFLLWFNTFQGLKLWKGVFKTCRNPDSYSKASHSCFCGTRTPFIILMWPKTRADRRWSSQMSSCYDISTEEWAAGVWYESRTGRVVWTHGCMDGWAAVGLLWTKSLCVQHRENDGPVELLLETHLHYISGTLDNYDLCDVAHESCYHYIHLQTRNTHGKQHLQKPSRIQWAAFFPLVLNGGWTPRYLHT